MDIVAWLVQHTDKTTTATLMGCSWTGVDNIVERVVAGHLVDDRLDNFYRIGRRRDLLPARPSVLDDRRRP